MENVIGRDTEKAILKDILSSGSPELIAVYGRRRVGKTFLIRNFLARQIVFEYIGSRGARLSVQLKNFNRALDLATGSKKIYRVPGNWPEAFEQLTYFLTPKLLQSRSVIFLDEFPWLNTHKSGFLAAFDHWWNSWANQQKNLVVIICGSAASWMIQNIVNNKAGLHNRITRKIRLLPFNLKETEAYLKSRSIRLDRFQILQLYMIMGGIPHYLKEVRKGESAAQAVERICFTKDGLLSTEFKNLYYSLFDDPSRHIAIVKALAANQSGLTRKEILEKIKLSSGGTVTSLLDELTESGFVTMQASYDRKTKDTVFKLADEFTHFYFKYMERSRRAGAGSWQIIASGTSWKSWSAVAFERICLKHIPQIKKALGISGIYTEEAQWRFSSKNEQGAQVDLVLDRKDFIINLCEMKFSESKFVIDKVYASELENRTAVFRNQSKTNKSIFVTFITTFGLSDNEYARRLVQNSITMNDLFA